MLFNSLEYLLFFLPISVIVFQLLSRVPGTDRQIVWLVIASLYFYASWKPIFLLLIMASVVINFTLGRVLIGVKQEHARLWLMAGVWLNLGLLGYFKYTGFFIDGLNALGQWWIPMPKITLPLAISFFTFQQIAYLVDVYRKECQEYRFSHYALFVLFFPQLIAGPIVHHKEIMPQFLKQRPQSQLPTDLTIGITFIAVGLFKKVIMADSLALIADPVFDSAAGDNPINSVDALLAIFAFSFQIYFDFSGYTDIAIGSARLFGIILPENFSSPYKSQSIIEIWRRWHMTLSRFLRDYLYFPLGGNRAGAINRYRNLLITMLLGGLWHGAAWTFVIWGGLHGFYLCCNHAWRALVARIGLRETFDHPLFRPVFVMITFLAWSVAMAFFRAADLPTALRIIQSAFIHLSTAPALELAGVFGDGIIARLAATTNIPLAGYFGNYALLLTAAILCWAMPNTQQFLSNYQPVITTAKTPLKQGLLVWKPDLRFAVLTALLLSISMMNISSLSRFIYFQF